MKVVIIGAGIGGLALAIACRRENLDVVVLERAPALEPIGAGIQIPPNAARVARQLGVLSALKENGVIVDSIEYVRYSNGKLLFGMDQKLIIDSFGDNWLVIARPDYHQVLWDAAKDAGAELRLDSEMEKIDFQGSCVHLVGGEKVNGDVIVGADGLWSRARDQLLEKDSPPAETGDLAYRCTIPAEDLQALNDEALNELMEKKSATCWMGPDRHCVLYPLKGGKAFNLVLLRPDNLPKDVRRAPGDLSEMRRSFEGFDPRLTKMISRVKSVLKWKLCHHEELESWTRESVVLLGDACHPTLPYQAQGAAMAVEDGAVLGKLLGLLNQSQSHMAEFKNRVPEILKVYETSRKTRTSANVQGAVSNRRSYHLPDGPEQEARDNWVSSSRSTPSPYVYAFADPKYLQTMLAFDCVADSIHAFKTWENKQRDLLAGKFTLSIILDTSEGLKMTDFMLKSPNCSIPRGLAFKSYKKRRRALRACLTETIEPNKGFSNDDASTVSESESRAEHVGDDSFVCSSNQHQMRVSSVLLSPGESCAQDVISIYTKLRNALLRSFFTHIHPFMPIIDMDEFLEAISSDGRYLQISLLLFQAIMFAGAACIPMCYLQRLGFDSRKEAREEFFNRVRLLYDFDYESDRLVLVQSLLLMTLWYKSPKEHRNTWHWIDVALSQAFATGLHIEPEKTIFSSQRCSLRRKIWWSCYATDKLISLTLKRPPKIRTGDFLVSMPEASDFQTYTEPKGGYLLLQAMCPYLSDDGLRSTLGRLFIDHVGLCRLMDPFLQSYRSPRVDEDKILSCESQTTESSNCQINSIEKLSVLRKRLTEWKASLPQVCQYKDYASTEFASTMYLHYTILHFTFHTLMLYTHRSTLIVAEHDQDYAEAQEAKKGMLDAARQISNLGGEVVEKGLSRFLPTSILAGVVHAAVINLQNAREQEEFRRLDSEEGLMQCLEVIRIMEEMHEPATLAKDAIVWAASRPVNHREQSDMGIHPALDIFADDPGNPYSLHESFSPDDHTGDGPGTTLPATGTSLGSADLKLMIEMYPVMMAWGCVADEEPIKAALDAEVYEHSTSSMEGLGIFNECNLSTEFRSMFFDTCSVNNST
ncbi:salicylate hydroxylase [Fusarium mexicanum]|uniref:Salicylate hydroxylase n=1 Tax=Fusarium mexicanum TaxID=751941 RepID=A0A8H5IQ38_9HYPO|nr:salicylate hydroxylase [Fusarium mexicanum]